MEATFIVCLATMAMGCPVMSTKSASATQKSALSSHHWAHRVVVVLQGPEGELYREQLDEFKALHTRSVPWGERALVLYACTRSDGGQVRDHTREDQEEQPSPVSAELCGRLRELVSESLDDAQGFGVYLVGKDGGIKIAQTHVLRTDELFGLIDSMPMRQREMRR
jgi:hypothetical protein